MQSISENLKTDMKCRDLMTCLYDLTETDVRVFEVLAEQKRKMKIDTITTIIHRDRGTVFRSLKRLRNYGFVSRDQINYDSGGYYHVYYVRNPKLKAKEIQDDLNKFYTKINNLIDEFGEKYSTA